MLSKLQFEFFSFVKRLNLKQIMKCLYFKSILRPELWILFLGFNLTLTINGQSFINVESGVLFTALNDIKNGSKGSIISLRDDLPTPPSLFFRCRAGFLLKNKHHFSILYAPLKVTVKGVLNKDILYDGESFKAQRKLEAVYKFNSYRFTYNRTVLKNEVFEIGLGSSLKIRDAGSSLKNQEFFKENFSIGFVPLFNLLLNYSISEKTSLNFFGEGIAATKGRAIDASLSGKYVFTRNLHGNIGYRILEGGADGTNRYNFIQLNFLFARLTFLY